MVKDIMAIIIKLKATFHSKKWCITTIVVHNKLKSRWHPLAIINTSKRLKILHNILEFKVHFESKLILIQQLDEEDWIKSMYIKYSLYFFDGHRALCLWFMKKYQIEKNENIMQIPFFKSLLLLYGIGFKFFKRH